ncbi:MAG: type III polyketide synthase [Lentisphaerae bacterium]|nr:type III polyketide synthase [Lentisphaerota bacterium]
MPALIHHIETLVPETAYSQAFIEARMRQWARTERQQRVLRQIYRHTSIDKRHSVVSDFVSAAPRELYRIDADGQVDNPRTGERNAFFVKHARPMAVELARRALAACPHIAPALVTHVITVSCTGFSNPGMDYHVVRELGLAASVQRYQLGFMGCYAALPALRMAAQFCAADPCAVVLVVCVELCTLHLHPRGTVDDMLANALFADGAACAVVSGRPAAEGARALALGEFASALVTEGESEMAWSIGDNGFDIVLSAYVPKIIGGVIRELVAPVLRTQSLAPGDVAHWAVHPGGRAIVDKVEAGLGLAPEQVAASREVLRRYGNMSSATVLFVLRELWTSPAVRPGEHIFAMAFGPGLAVESALLEVRGAMAGSAAAAGTAGAMPLARAMATGAGVVQPRPAGG